MQRGVAREHLSALAKPVQDWIEKKKWSSLRPIQLFAIQALAIQNIVSNDLILSAPTAGGKTAAALLPLLSRLAGADADQERTSPPPSFEILFISPLRALIRQQSQPENDIATLAGAVNGRLVHPWMSDIARTQKDKSWDHPSGILLITPESLESIFVHRPHEILSRFTSLTAVVIDELHAYFDSPRGAQLMSLLNRLEIRLKRSPIQRIALSATLGDGGEESQIATYRFLRPPLGNPAPAEILSQNAGTDPSLYSAEDLLDIHIEVESEEDLTGRLGPEAGAGRTSAHNAKQKICTALRSIFDRDDEGPKKGLIFTNSRHDAETYAALLDKRSPTSAANEIADEALAGIDEAKPADEQSDDRAETRRYLPHHGSLSQKSREAAESRMLNKNVPAVLVCTTTLELGIDVGEINEVAQIGPGPSVASLRQRLGRSGRMSSLLEKVPPGKKGQAGQHPRLHIFLREPQDEDSSPLMHRLHLQTFQSLAQVELLRKRQFEMPHMERTNLSTLVQQIVSLVFEYREEGLTLGQARKILVEQGPFHATGTRLYREEAQTVFEAVVHRLANRSRPVIDFDGLDGRVGDDVELFLAPEGEAIISRRMIYTAFQTPVEYTVRSASRILGSAALTGGLSVGDRILFSGKAWEISEVSQARRIVYVRPTAGGQAVHFTGDAIPPSETLVAKMKELYGLPLKEFQSRIDSVAKLNAKAKAVALAGHKAFEKAGLKNSPIPAKEKGPDLWIYPWLGERRLNGLYLLLRWAKLPVIRSGLALMVSDCNRTQVSSAIKERLMGTALPHVLELVRGAGGISGGKFNFYLNPSLRRKDFASSQIDVTGLNELLAALAADG